MRKAICIYLPFFLVLISVSLSGQSIFSFREEGEAMLIGDAHMAGLGYGEVPGTFSSTICGSIAFLRSAGIDVSYLGTRLEMSDEEGENTVHYYGIPYLKAATALPRDIAFGFNLRKSTDFNSSFMMDVDSVNGIAFQESFWKKGQLSIGALELAKRLTPHIGFGISLDVLFGGSEEVWITNFQDTTYRDTRDSLKSAYFGVGYGLGFVLNAQPISIAAGYRFPLHCDKSTRSLSYLRPDTTLSEDEITFPGEAVIGIDFFVREDLNIVATARYRDWSNFKLNGSKGGEYSNVISYSVGMEYKRSKGYKQRQIPLRIGFFHNPWYFSDSYGERIADSGITLGTAIPILRKDGFLDIAFAAGRRKTTELEERFYSVQLGFNFYERW
jgi:hypothetical protein